MGTFREFRRVKTEVIKGRRVVNKMWSMKSTDCGVSRRE